MRLPLLYLLLIGMPVLGILGLLRLGRDLTPPLSVRGSWVAQLDRRALGEMRCDEALGCDQTILTISQSGTHLLITLNDKRATTFDGQIQEAAVIAEARSPLATAAIHLQAEVDRQTDPQRLQGVFILQGSPSSIQVPFVATRL